jgi:hypothetical protein
VLDKKNLSTILKALGLIDDKTTGQVVIHTNEGGVTKVEKKVEVK